MDDLEIDLVQRGQLLSGQIQAGVNRLSDVLPALETELEGRQFDEIGIDVVLKAAPGDESSVYFDNLQVLKTFLSV